MKNLTYREYRHSLKPSPTAGLTHGGFYGQFSSNEDLMAKAGERALADIDATWRAMLEAAPDDPLYILASAYLSTAHRDHPGAGCALAALGADAARSSAPVRHALTEGFNGLLNMLAGLMPAARKPKDAKRPWWRMPAWRERCCSRVPWTMRNCRKKSCG